jgi:hypothetical protein
MYPPKMVQPLPVVLQEPVPDVPGEDRIRREHVVERLRPRHDELISHAGSRGQVQVARDIVLEDGDQRQVTPPCATAK